MLKQQIKADVIVAMKSSDQKTAGVLRMTIASVNTKEKEKRYVLAKADSSMAEDEMMKKSELSDEEVIMVLSSEIKKRRDAITLYEQGGRPELAQSEKEEIAILQKYLPEQLSVEELKKLVEESIKKTGAASIKDMGKIMVDLIPKVKGRAEGGEISKLIKEALV